MKKWVNGASGSEVKQVIDDNFATLDERTLEIKNKIETVHVKDFALSDWSSGVIFIPYATYKKYEPCVELYIKNNNKYSVVYGGYVIDKTGIELQSDMPYEGRVVIR